MDMNLSKLWEIVKDKELGLLQSMESQSHDLATEQQKALVMTIWWWDKSQKEDGF